MGFRFRRRIRIGLALYVNVSKSGLSTSIGGRIAAAMGDAKRPPADVVPMKRPG